MPYLIGAVALVVLLVLINIRLFRGGPGRAAAPFVRPRLLNCPVCGSKLSEGQRVRTAAYPGNSERLVHIYGCPRCYGLHADLRRNCPVCRRKLKGDDHLVGRLLREEGQKGRVKVWGCSRCAGPRQPEQPGIPP
jgi:hypothetical protein